MKGRDGRDGLAGPPGTAGRDGKDGEMGKSGGPGIQGPPGPSGPSSGGVVYTRWGRTTCPSTPGTELVYEGRAGGSFYSQQGGGANYLCMPEDPDYPGDMVFQPGVQGWSYVYGTEYQPYSAGPLSAFHNYQAPCAVCYVPGREISLMIPAKTQCPTSWTKEYYGYLMTAYKGSDHYRTTYECVDKDPEAVSGSVGDQNGALFYHVEANCNGMPCPQYDPEKELTCVVCTK